MTEKLRVRLLPGNRYELRLKGFIPVDLSAATYFSKSVAELRQMVEEMTLYAYVLSEKFDYELPREPCRFIEGRAERYELTDSEDADEFLSPLSEGVP